MNILLVEDDFNLASAIIDFLELDTNDVDYADNGISALRLAESNSYDVIVLDLNLPKLSGLDVCKRLRDAGVSTSIIMLTARHKLEHKLEGFDAGADDYLVKPFSMLELVARLKVHSGRVSSMAKKIQTYGFIIETETKCITYRGNPIEVTPTEYRILELLIKNSPKPVSKEIILDSLWGSDKPESNSLNVHIHGLRKLIRKHCELTNIQTVKNYGYAIRFNDDGKV